MRNSCLHIAKCTLARMHVFFELAKKPHERQTFNENKKNKRDVSFFYVQ